MVSIHRFVRLLPAVTVLLFAWGAVAQSFRVQCPTSTAIHPLIGGAPNPSIKCQQISGGEGFATMGDGTQTYMFGFGPLSGLKDIVNALPGTQPASVFNADNTVFGVGNINIGDPQPGYGHVDPRLIMDVGVMNASQPAPLFAIDEDDEFFLTLTNVGQVMRPDLFEQHTVHFHGYPNASSFYDGVPDASIAINIGGSFTYYYLAPEAGTYFWHCHISPPEHLQMGMVGQIYVRPRQNRVTGDLGVALKAANTVAAYGGTTGVTCNDILCTGQTPLPAGANATTGATGVNGGGMYAYNDGDGSTRYDVEYPIQMMGELPLRRHDLQPGILHRHEGQVLHAQRAQLPRHDFPWHDADAVNGRHPALLAAAADHHQHPGRWQGAAQDLGPQRHGVLDARIARHSDEGHRDQCAAAA